MKNGSKNYAADGFSYMEMLLSLMTAALIMAVMPNILTLFQSLELHDDDYDKDIFILDITDTYNASEEMLVTGTSAIQFKTVRGDVSYRYQSGRIIKSIDGEGFVTLMFNIDEFTVSESADSITLKLKGAGDETFIFKK